MKKSVWISMIVAGACILAGVACMAVGHILGGHKILVEGAKNDHDMVTNTFTPVGEFDRISVDIISANVRIHPTDTAECRVVTCDRAEMAYDVTVADGTLTITVTDTRNWYDDLFTAYRRESTVTVYLPVDAYESLTVKTASGDIEVDGAFTFTKDVIGSTASGSITVAASAEGRTYVKTSGGSIHLSGNAGALTAYVGSGSVIADGITVLEETKLSSTSGRVELENATVGSLSAHVGSGNLKLEDLTVTDTLTADTVSGDLHFIRVTCVSLTAETPSGRIELIDSVATGHISVKTTSGAIRLERADAETLYLKTGSGSVKGSLRTPKVFYADTTSGSVDVPKSTEGGLCEIKTVSGSIRITIADTAE